MKIARTTCPLFVLLVMLSCTPKNHQYYDTSGREIGASKYDRLNNYLFNLELATEEEGKTVSRLYDRRKFGRMTAGQLQDFRESLELSLDQKLDFSTDLCIGYFDVDYSMKEDCVEYYLTEKRFDFTTADNYIGKPLNYISVLNKAHSNTKLAELYFIDRKHVILDNFFVKGIACDHWLVLRPDGQFRYYYAEGGSAIFDELDHKWDDTFIQADYNKLKELSNKNKEHQLLNDKVSNLTKNP